jgi:MutS domain V
VKRACNACKTFASGSSCLLHDQNPSSVRSQCARQRAAVDWYPQFTGAQVIGAPTLFATHFHELTAITGTVGVANRHMQTALDEANAKLSMLYSVVDGACDQSFGIHVAEFARFPAEVVERAKAKLAQLEAGGAPQEQARSFAVLAGDRALHSLLFTLSMAVHTLETHIRYGRGPSLPD